MRSCSRDVAVVGAGPAGAVAACELARGGQDVVLIEKEPLPRYKPCGGGVVARAWPLLPARARAPVHHELTTAEVWQDFECLASVRRAEPIIRMVMRDEFDTALAAAARTAGAELLAPCTLQAVTPRDDGLELGTTRGPLRVRFLIAADGTSGTAARLTGWAPQTCTVPAIEAEVPVPERTLHAFRDAARFDLRTPEGGYSWVFPKRDHLSLGVIAARKPVPALKRALAGYMDRLGLPREDGFAMHGWRVPARARPEGPARGRVLLVGDAAGLADPLTFEGITHAMLSGRLAARAILEGRFVPGAVACGYRALLAARVLPDLAAGRILARLIYARSRLVDRLLARMGCRLAERLTGVFLGEESMLGVLQRALLPRWARGPLLERSGARAGRKAPDAAGPIH